jgi:hypothetical protein
MSAEVNEVICPCAMPGIEEFRQLVFSDGDKIMVRGLDRTFEIAYQEGKLPDNALANELVNQLSKENYIPSNERVRLEYAIAVLREYRKFFEKKEQRKKEVEGVSEGT